MSTQAFKYHFAVVSRIPNSFKDHALRRKEPDQPIDIDLARRQHEEYVETLRRLGIDVLELPHDERHPDCVFVEDCAVVINGTALICKPGAPSRLGEVAVIRQTLRKELGLKIAEIDKEQATLDGGDVLWTGKEIFVGVSKRTNIMGAQAVAKAFPEYPTMTVMVPNEALHLKSYITVAGKDVLAVGKSRIAQQLLQSISESATYSYKTLTLEEDTAANTVFANNVVVHQSDNMIPKSFPIFENKLDTRVTCDFSEIAKADGCLSSLCLLITKIKHPKNFITTLQDDDLQKHVNLDYLDTSSPGGTINRSTMSKKK